MSKQIIVADAGPLIAFGRLNKIFILSETLGSILVPETVIRECTADPSRSGAKAIQCAIDDKTITIQADFKNNESMELSVLLGPGETAAIKLARKLSCGLLIDEKLARGVAAKLHLKIIGSVGVLLLAKRKNIIAEILPIINDLKKVGYYLSDKIIQEAAIIAGE